MARAAWRNARADWLLHSLMNARIGSEATSLIMPVWNRLETIFSHARSSPE